MKSIKKFEAFEGEEEGNVRGWKDDLLMVYDYFAELADYEGISQIDYQAGFRESSGPISYVCFLQVNDAKGEEIIGREDLIEHRLSVNSKILLRVMFRVKFQHGNYSPFRTSGSASYFGENADLLLDIMNKLNLIKKRISSKYNIGITMETDWFYINFLEK